MSPTVHISDMNVDRQNVPRGRCTEPDCSCAQYMRGHALKKCGHCGHIPPAHVDLINT